MPRLPAPARYVPYHEIGDDPHIVVDGKDQASTLLSLSHWPWNRTPDHLREDTSTHIVYTYLDDPAAHVDVSVVSNSHYDEDGLLSMFALVDPELAYQHRDLCIATSYATDFWRCTDETAAKLAFVLGAWSDKESSPLGPKVFSLPLRQRIIEQYRGMLRALPGILADPFSDTAQWQAEYDFWQQSRELLAAGHVRIELHPDVDLAVIHVPDTLPCISIRRYLLRWDLPVHPFAIFEHTDCSRILWVQGQHMSFQYRYESWVQVIRFRPLPRVDLTPLAEHLNALEPANAQWAFEGVNEVAARLQIVENQPTGLSAAALISELIGFLAQAPSAWDPHGPEPAYESSVDL
ncbi:MAG: hypothetical protein ACI80M_000528 [Gammaproteobacteria bacterium]